MNGAAFFIGGGSTGLVCPGPVFTPTSGSGTTSVTVSAPLSGAYIFYKKSSTGALPTHTGATAGAGTSRIGTGSGNPSGNITVTGNNFMEAITYKAGYMDSPVTEGYYGTETIDP